MAKKIQSIIFSFFILCLLAISISSASSVYDDIPDLCLPYNTTYYDIWLEDYYHLDNDENVTIRFLDPVNSNIINLPNGYYSLNLECFEVANYFAVRDDVYTDLVRIETYDDSCSVVLYVALDSDESLGQSFTLTSTDDCDTYVNESTSYYNYSASSIWGDLIGYYSFDSSLQDSYGRHDLSYTGNRSDYTYVTGKRDKALSRPLVSGSDAFTTISSLQSFSDGNYSLSFWFNFSSNSGTNYIIDSGCFEVRTSGADLAYQPYCSTAVGRSAVMDGDWHHVVITDNPSHTIYTMYYDGAYVTNISRSGNSFVFNGTFDMKLFDGFYIDELALFSGTISVAEVATLYNGGSGFYPDSIDSPYKPNSSAIPDLYMNTSENVSVDLSTYFGNWEDMYVTADDPWNDYSYKIYTGYATLNTDYYELLLYANGTLDLTSYARPYTYEIGVFACNYTPYEECTNETFNVIVQGNITNVTQLNQFQAYYNLGLTGSQLFSGNYFYQYYDEIVLSFPESNYTGILNSTFPFRYTEIDNPIRNATYMVYLNCSISDTPWTYNYLGDVNITLECGDLQSYYTLSAYNNYNQRIYLTACNSLGCQSDYTQLLAGNPNWTSGYIPPMSELSPNQSWFDNNINSFNEILPDDLNDSSQLKLAFVIIFVILVVTFIFTFAISFKLSVYLCIIELIVLLFFFANANYVNPFYPVIILVVFVLYHLLKLFKGGS